MDLRKISHVVDNFLNKKCFSACGVGFCGTKCVDHNFHEQYFWAGTTAPGGCRKVDRSTFFDLASLTKPLVTSLCLISLMKEGFVRSTDPLSRFFSVKNADIERILVCHLANHISGLPAHKSYYKRLINYPLNVRKDLLIDYTLRDLSHGVPGIACEYSDLGYILLGAIIEKITGMSLDSYWQKKIVRPLGLENDFYFGEQGKEVCRSFVTCGLCSWSGETLEGIVHDDNCRAVGGVCGHAGLFGTVRGVLLLAKEVLLQYIGKKKDHAYSATRLKEFLKQGYPGGWRGGFDTPSAGYSSSGRFFSADSIGHLGFTGTSLWIDLQRKTIIVLLTNRVVYKNTENLIREFRPLIHDMIMEEVIREN